jgi:hypothetical protein
MFATKLKCDRGGDFRYQFVSLVMLLKVCLEECTRLEIAIYIKIKINVRHCVTNVRHRNKAAG